MSPQFVYLNGKRRRSSVRRRAYRRAISPTHQRCFIRDCLFWKELVITIPCQPLPRKTNSKSVASHVITVDARLPRLSTYST